MSATPAPAERPAWRDYSPALIRFIRTASHVLTRFPYNVSFAGQEHIPASGAAVLAPNHASFFDPWFTSLATRRRVYYLAWHGLFKSPAFASFIESLGARPVNIDNPSDRTAWRTAHAILREGHLLCIFPEGIRGFDGRLNPLQQGFVRIAQGSGVPIVPVWISGALSTWPRWRKLPRLGGTVGVRAYPAIPTLDPATGKKRDPAAVIAEYRKVMLVAEDTALGTSFSRESWTGATHPAEPAD